MICGRMHHLVTHHRASNEGIGVRPQPIRDFSRVATITRAFSFCARFIASYVDWVAQLLSFMIMVSGSYRLQIP